MRYGILAGLLIAMGAGLAGCGHLSGQTGSMDAEGMLAHNVYFTLQDNAEAEQEALVQDCIDYLKDQPGVVFFAAGTLAEEYDRPVNVTDFDVSLHIVFDSPASHDRYQDDEDHLTFIERNEDNWESVQVFDSMVEQ
ncbi:MAG: Dabb family protein [Candidatus Hydrogenedentota bacterium]